ncbi:MAG: hypothetical protein NTX12_04715 [Actinobacteria bacterium]|nr:hypothetical protein [Actinomycetota bacterium]
MISQGRSILFVVNPNRSDARAAADELADFFRASGFALYANPEAELSGIPDFDAQHLTSVELAIVLGGDVHRSARKELYC